MSTKPYFNGPKTLWKVLRPFCQKRLSKLCISRAFFCKINFNFTLKFGCKSPFLGDNMSRNSLPKVLNPTSRILLNLWMPLGSSPRLTILWDKSELVNVSKWRTRSVRSEDMVYTIERKIRAFSTIFLIRWSTTSFFLLALFFFSSKSSIDFR